VDTKEGGECVEATSSIQTGLIGHSYAVDSRAAIKRHESFLTPTKLTAEQRVGTFLQFPPLPWSLDTLVICGFHRPRSAVREIPAQVFASLRFSRCAVAAIRQAAAWTAALALGQWYPSYPYTYVTPREADKVTG
jgi:hypothetical protein